MNRYLFSLFVALLIHLCLALLFLISIDSVQKNKKIIAKKDKRMKISLQNMIIPKKKVIKKTVIKKIIEKKSIIKKSIIKKPKKAIVKKHKIIKKIKPKPKKIIHKYKIKPIRQKIIKQKEIINKDPMSWLYEDKSSQENKQQKIENKNNLSSIDQNIKELYGWKFDTLSKAQQDYILDNQEIMRRITQRVLNRVASVNLKNNLRVNTSNIIEFYLYPNGDMSDFKFLKKTGYFELDDTTKETIEYAYSQYPRPKEKTLIRYNVFYNLR